MKRPDLVSSLKHARANSHLGHNTPNLPDIRPRQPSRALLSPTDQPKKNFLPEILGHEVSVMTPVASTISKPTQIVMMDKLSSKNKSIIQPINAPEYEGLRQKIKVMYS